jgi:hypothetical protein
LELLEGLVRNNWGHQLLSNPRTGVLEYSQPSLAGLFLVSSLPRTNVLGYSQPSLRDLVRKYVLTQNLKSPCGRRTTSKSHVETYIS